MADWRDIYDFWFGAPGSDGHGEVREFWFASTPDIDREIEERFLDQYRRAAAGDFEDWKSDARGWVALIVLLDQVPRMFFAETANPSRRIRSRWRPRNSWRRARCIES